MKDFKNDVLPWFFPKKLQIWQYFEDEEEKTAAEEHLRATTTGQFRQSERGDAADLARGARQTDTALLVIKCELADFQLVTE